MSDKDIEILDIDDISIDEKNESSRKKKRKVIKGKIILTMGFTILLLMTSFISVQYFCGLDLFEIYDEKKIDLDVTNINEAYTNSKNGRNLTFYDDGTFKFMDIDKVVDGTYKVDNDNYILIYDNSICELVKTSNFVYSTCSLIMNDGDNDYMISKNSQITKILYNVEGSEYDKLTKSFLSYINALPTTNKFPSLKSSRVDSIKDCFSTDDLKTLTCSISYTIIPNEADLTKSVWLENGTIEKGAIRKSHYITFNNDSEYKFIKMSSNI